MAVQDLEKEADEPFVLGPLPEEPPALRRRLEPPRDALQLGERAGRGDPRGREEVGPVEEEPDFGPEGDAVETTAEEPGGERPWEEGGAFRLFDVAVEREEPAGRRGQQGESRRGAGPARAYPRSAIDGPDPSSS